LTRAQAGALLALMAKFHRGEPMQGAQA
jgi:hypothetical protein